MSQETLHSYHIFLFPFKWEIYQGKDHQQYPLVKRSKLSEILPKVNADYWENFSYEPRIDDDGFCTYGEYNYFYDFTRDVLNLNPEYEGVNVKQYRHKGVSDASRYHINAKGTTYTLQLEEVVLNLYENGVGVVSLFLQNYDHADKKDIFLINDFGRRIYPQYLGGDTPLTASPKDNFLAQKISLTQVRTWLGSSIIEDFSHYDSLYNLRDEPFVIPRHLSAFFGENFHAKHPNLQTGDVFIHPMIDDRMFTICIHYNQAWLNELASRNKENNGYNYLNNSGWYQLIFVDGQYASCHSPEMMNDQLKNATYDRWLVPYYPPETGDSWGQLFGVSRYSFVAIAAPGRFNEFVIRKHISHQYFQLVLLSLVQRAFVINFSGEVARISQRLSSDRSLLDKETSAISQLYLLYIKFVNRIFFREITHQEQGIELYSLLQERMGLRDDVKDLGAEISELSNYAETQQQNRLTWIAGRFLPPSLVAGLFGINAYNVDGTEFNVHLWWAISLILVTFILSDYILNFIRFKK